MNACQPRLMAMEEMEEMVEYLKDEVPALEGDHLQVPPLLAHSDSPAAGCPHISTEITVCSPEYYGQRTHGAFLGRTAARRHRLIADGNRCAQ